MSADLGRRPAATLRLTFEYDENGIHLLDRLRVEKLAPPSDPVSGHEGQHGFWVELRDAGGRILHRRVMHDPFVQDREVFLPDPDHTIARRPVEEMRGTFIVEVPEVEGADHVALFSSAASQARSVQAAAGPAPAVEVARVALR